MVKLYEGTYSCTNKSDALHLACNMTGFSKDEFKCEIIEESKKVGLLKREPGRFHCWYEYENFDSDKKFELADASIYFDNSRKKILVARIGFKVYEVGYSGLKDYEIVIAAENRTMTIANSNKALKGALLFGVTGAVVGAAKTEEEKVSWDVAGLIIRLIYNDKESFEIATCNYEREVNDKEWRDILDQGEEVAQYLKMII